MRIQHLFEFTEHHRYYCYRDFALSTVDYRMLSLIYKPLVGAFAISLFEQLVMAIPDGQTGYSKLEPHRKLLLSLGLALNEKNRSYLMEQLSKLEAMNLLQSSRFLIDEQGDYVYEYELQKPLSPDEFFQNIHFTMLLRDKLGKYAVIELRQQFHAEAPKEVVDVPYDKEQLTTPFYEIFQLNATIVDDELEQALNEIAPTRMNRQPAPTLSAGYTLAEILLRFPRNSANRYYVEQLKNYAEQLAQVNYIAYKYELSISQVCHLLDEDGVFDVAGELNIDELQKLAIQFYKQDQKHELDKATIIAKQAQVYYDETAADEVEVDVDEQYYLPVPKQIVQNCDIQQYNALMRNEPYTKFLKRIFPGEVPEMLFKQFTVIDLQYKLSPPVINVLIHYVIGANDSSRITRGYIESVASNMLMKGIDTYEKAILYVREQDQLDKQKQQKQLASASIAKQANTGRQTQYRGSNTKSWNQQKSRPFIPTVSSEDTQAKPVSQERLEELLKLADKLEQQ